MLDGLLPLRGLEVAQQAVEGLLVGVVVFPVPEVADVALAYFGCPGLVRVLPETQDSILG